MSRVQNPSVTPLFPGNLQGRGTLGDLGWSLVTPSVSHRYLSPSNVAETDASASVPERPEYRRIRSYRERRSAEENGVDGSTFPYRVADIGDEKMIREAPQVSFPGAAKWAKP
jgi:hypothetical protein